MEPVDWKIRDFSLACATGTLESPSTGRVASFPIEAWWPCEPVLARLLQDDDHRRSLLDPRPGEPVAVDWRRSRLGGVDVVSRVTRLHPIAAEWGTFTFEEWFSRVSLIVEALQRSTRAHWLEVAGQVDGGAADLMQSNEPRPSPEHLGLLAWLGQRVSEDFRAQHLLSLIHI